MRATLSKGIPLRQADAAVEKDPVIDTGDVLAYYDHLAVCLKRVDVTAQDGTSLSQGEALTTVIGWARAAHAAAERGRELGK